MNKGNGEVTLMIEWNNISYSGRAKWYNIETGSDEQNSFLSKMLETYQLPIIIQIPCSSGKNLVTLAKKSKVVIGLDIDEEMLSIACNKIEKEGIGNCIIQFGNLIKFRIDKAVDLVIVLNEAIQLFNPDNGELFQVINNILTQLDGDLLIESFDFKNPSNKEKLRYYSYSQVGRIMKDFEYSNKHYILKRYHKANMDEEKVMITYYYKIYEINKHIWKWYRSKLKLYHFEFEKFKKIVEQCGGYIKKVYSDYDMSYLKNSSKKLIVIGCKREEL